MKRRVTQKIVLGGAVLCAALLGCALYYWIPARAPVSQEVVAEIPKPQQENQQNEETKEAVPEPPSQEEKKEEPSIEQPAPPPEVKEEAKPPVVVAPPEVVKKPEVPPPVLKKPEPTPPEIKNPEPVPAPPQRLQPPVVKEPEQPPVIIEQPAPPVEKKELEVTPPPVIIEEPAPSVEKPRATYLRPTYFINREVESDNIKMFPRWTGMLTRYNSEAHKLDDVCGPRPHPSTPCKLKEWKDFLEELREAPLLDKLREVNRFLNKYPYIDDIVNWGFDNYWETPYEFQRKSGNCKDYAIAKFMSLRAIGVPNDIMRVVVLKDLNLGGVIHAILVVSADEKSYILDNQIKQLVTTDKVYHYVPIYSINEDHWWQHFVSE